MQSRVEPRRAKQTSTIALVETDGTPEDRERTEGLTDKTGQAHLLFGQAKCKYLYN